MKNVSKLLDIMILIHFVNCHSVLGSYAYIHIMEGTKICIVRFLGVLSIYFLRLRQGGGRGQEDEPALHLLCAGGQRGHGRRPDPQDPDVPRVAVGGGATKRAENKPSRIHDCKA